MLSSVMHKIQAAFQQQTSQLNLSWMDTLPGMSELDALIEIRAHLVKIEFSDLNNVSSKIETVLEIDKNTYQNIKKITHKYLNSLKINRELESEIQNAVYLYQRQLYVVYTQFLDLYLTQNKTKLSAEKIHLILARYLNAIFIMAKWRYFDDQPAPIGTWANVHKVIKTAEDLAIMNKNLMLYDFQIKETSIAALLKRGFMMDTLHKGNYTAQQIQLTELVLKIWASNPLMVTTYKRDYYQFFIALGHDRGPERVRELDKFADCRYWRTTRLVDLIEAYLCAVDTEKSLEEFGLSKMASVSVMVKLFKKLRAEWCVEGYTRQRRKEVRHKNSKLLNVSHGLDDICSRLRAMQVKQESQNSEEDGFSFDLKVAMHRKNRVTPPKPLSMLGSENWWLVDESDGGFAVDLGKAVSDWTVSGFLVGYTSPDEKNVFSVAEIKSVRKQASGNYRAGLELISKDGVVIQASRADKQAGHEAVSGYYVEDSALSFAHLKTFSAILVKQESQSVASTATIIMPLREYKRGSRYHVHIDGEDKLVQAGRVLARQHDWIRVEIPL
ncbi:MAG: hypothetical protein ACT4OH_02300 [Methylophilaceae bacterium]